MLVYNIRFLCLHDDAIKSPLDERKVLSKYRNSVQELHRCFIKIYKLLLISFTQNKFYLSEQFSQYLGTLTLFILSTVHNIHSICNYFLVILLQIIKYTHSMTRLLYCSCFKVLRSGSEFKTILLPGSPSSKENSGSTMFTDVTNTLW